MNISQEILSEITVFNKYARYLPAEKRRESWERICLRNKQMHLERYPSLRDEIEAAYVYICGKLVLPSMRALEDSTPIITREGWKTAGEVAEGDVLYDSSGCETVVQGVVKFSDRELFRVVFSDRSELVACAEHLWIVSTLDDRRHGGTRVVDTAFLRDHLKQGDLFNIAVWNPFPIQRPPADLKVDPYILGHWLGDGYSSGYQYSAGVEDAPFFKEKYQNAGYGGKQPTSTNIWTYTAHGLASDLREYDLLGNKHIPREYLMSSVEQRLSLLQGLVDSDGCIEPGGRCHFVNTNIKLIEGVQELLSSLGIKYVEGYTEREEGDILQDLYVLSFHTALEVSLLPRKAQFLRREESQRTQHRTVKCVEPAGKGNATCFHVDAPDHSFLAGRRMVVTHNSIQFAGKAIKVNPSRIFNCSFCHIDHYKVFSEIMFLLLGGTGVGYSVQRHHVEKLPEIRKPVKTRRFVIDDSIEGWATSIKMLIKAYLCGRQRPLFVYDQIRPKGSRLVTAGGKAPGPEPLRKCLVQMQELLDTKVDGDKLTPLECHDLICIMADAVLAGGIRRAALISLFSIDDVEMMNAKAPQRVDSLEQISYMDGQFPRVEVMACLPGSPKIYNFFLSGAEFDQYNKTGTVSWNYFFPWRSRANNSVATVRSMISKKRFREIWKVARDSGSGEPGIYLTNNPEWGCNPSLRAGTKVVTDTGVYPIEELEGREFFVKNLEGQMSPAECWLSGKDQSLYKITLQSGKEYYATAEHEWPVWDGDSYSKVSSAELCAGDHLPVIRQSTLFEGTLGDYNDGFVVGWLYGDGWITNRRDVGCPQYGFIVSKGDQQSGIQNRILTTLREKTDSNADFYDRQGNLELNTVSRSLHEYFQQFGVGSKEEGLPSAIWKDGSESFRRGFLDGLFSADGQVETAKKRVSLSSSRKKIIEDVSDLLGFYGVRHTVRSQKRTGIPFPNGEDYNKEYTLHSIRVTGGRSLRHFSDLVSLTHREKNERLVEYRYPRPFEKDQIEVVSVEKTDLREDVWDIRVGDDTHCFQISHCITGNCCEIGQRSNSFCNLTTVNVATVTSQEDLEKRVRVAAFLGTLQAGYTDFHYLREVWKRVTEKEALLGISMTGIAMCEVFDDLDLAAAAQVAVEENERVADKIGINPAHRLTCVKPEGTSSCVLGTTSGIHAAYWYHYIRRIRVNKDDPLYIYLKKAVPSLAHDEVHGIGAVLEFPQKCSAGAIVRTEPTMEMLGRVKRVYDSWVMGGHREGHNTHNISATVYVRDGEWDEVIDWLWENRDSYNGMTVLPYDGGSYVQAPFEECTEEEYNERMATLKRIDLTQITEYEDRTDLQGELACAGGACEVKNL